MAPRASPGSRISAGQGLEFSAPQNFNKPVGRKGPGWEATISWEDVNHLTTCCDGRKQLPRKENKVGDPSWRLCSLQGTNESPGSVPSGLSRKPRYASPGTPNADPGLLGQRVAALWQAAKSWGTW